MKLRHARPIRWSVRGAVRTAQLLEPVLPNFAIDAGKRVLDSYYGGWKYFRPQDPREYDPEGWQHVGDCQIEFLRSAGLDPDDRVFDIGSGYMRGATTSSST
jgi:hypothetical protein